MKELMPNILGGLGCMAAGYAMIFRPDIVWKIEHLFTRKPYDPGKSYPATLRTLGSIFVLMGLYMAVLPLLEIM